MKIVLWPHGGSGNHGCEAIVRATGDVLGDVDPELFSSAPEQDVRYGLDRYCTVRRDVAPINRFSSKYLTARLRGGGEKMDELAFAPVIEAAGRSDLFMSIGGDNYCYGVNRHILLVNRCVRRRGVKTVLWGCSVGEDAIGNREVLEDLAAFDLIVARESITFEALRAAGVKSVTLHPDPAFLLERRDEPLPDGFAEGNTVGINLSPMVIGNEGRAGATLAGFERLVGHILSESDMNVALVPHVVWSHNDDREPLRLLHEKFAHTGRVVMIPDAPAPVLKGYIARCRFFVASRTHASIAAYSQGVPTLVAGYSVKARGIARDIFGNEQEFVVPVQSLRTGDELTAAFDNMHRHESSIRKRYESVMPEYRARAAAAKNEIMKL